MRRWFATRAVEPPRMKKMFGFVVVFLSMLAVPAPAQAPAAYPTLSPSPELSPPPFPANGTYAYGIFRDGKRVGETRFVVLRRNELNAVELYESGSYGTVSIRVHASLGYAELLPKPWDVTYAGAVAMGAQARKVGDAKRFTVRYVIDQDGGYDIIDGAVGGDVMPLWSIPQDERHTRYQMVLDPPFLAGFFAMPATLALRGESYVAPISEAFWNSRIWEPVTPIYPKAAFSSGAGDRGLRGSDFTLYYGAKTFVVDAASFEKGLSAKLESTSKSTAAAISFGAP